MNASSNQLRGFCPGLWNPMPSGDGLIVRVATGHRTLTAAQVGGLAALADAHGNGLLEVTRRANVQLRGIRESSLALLQEGLLALDLAGPRGALEVPLLVSPLVGLHAACAGLSRLSGAIAAALQASVDSLPAKFSVVLDAAGSLRGVRADLRLEVDSVRAPGWVRMSAADGVFDDPGASSEPRADRVLGVCRSEDAPQVVERLIEARLARSHARRASSGLRARERAADGAARGERRERHDLRAYLQPRAWPEPEPAIPFIGAQRATQRWFGVALPFGATAESFRALASAAERFGQGELRTTPLRGMLLTGVGDADLPQLSAAARAHGWVSDPADPLLRVAACAGAPACSSASGETRALARRLGATLRNGESLHVSGCAKGCAHSGPASLTIVHAPDGSKLGLDASAAQAAEQPARALGAIELQLHARLNPPETTGSTRERALPALSVQAGSPEP
jgi:precorrin-3B synthase